jgi:hypothetical protein
MWPWGHAAAGYLLYSLFVRATGERPTGVAVLTLAVGTQFPDLVDKTLGWEVGVLPGGRTLAHSLLTVAVLWAVVTTVTRRYGRSVLGQAFLVGTLIHILTDGLYSAIEGDFADLSYLLWPVLPMPEEDAGLSIISMFAEMTLTTTVIFELGLVALAAGLWWADGRPGLATVRTIGRQWLAQLTPS